MPGMNSGLNVNDPTVIQAFKYALIHQGIIAVLIFGAFSIIWAALGQLKGPAGAEPDAAISDPEPAWRQLLRIGFGILWIFDGILQAQPEMPVGLPSQVIEPTAASSPRWVQELVNWAGTTWSYHPIQAAAGVVWIQVGLGIWLLVAGRGRMSRLAGTASVGWAIVIWVFGESFGGILAPGLSWLTGAPGAAAFYAVAGVLVALPVRSWRWARLGQLLLTGTGVLLAAMAILQAWPGRGFWQGSFDGQPGSLTAMVKSMAGVSQPTAISDLLSWFGGVVRADGFIVNLVAVVLLAGPAIALLTRRRSLARPAVIAIAIFSLADWVLVQDLGFFGGLGTDPNSAIPMILLVVAGYLALVHAPQETPSVVTDPVPATSQAASVGPDPAPASSTAPDRPGRWRPAAWPGQAATMGIRTLASAGAIGVILLGGIPMAAAQVSPNAAPILAESIDGSSTPLGSPAPSFSLTDQRGKPVALAGLHGKVVLLTFLDPVCVTDCPLIAQEFREAGNLLSGDRAKVELVAVNLNPLYSGVSYLQAFDRQEQLATVPNWLYLTGSPAQLQAVWRKYGVTSVTVPAGAMLGHSDVAFVISRNGRLQEELDFDPGPGTAATRSSFATELATAARQELGAP
jgi:cytochrome oxidase Cu insertion factor (SCO1/SenC/PrrC family)